MKIISFILLVGFLTYFTETIALPLTGICSVAGKTACCEKSNKGACMMGMHDKQPKKPGQSCGDNTVCADCPLCYTMVPVNYKSPEVPFVISIQKYITAESNLIPGFIAKKWKPPMAG